VSEAFFQDVVEDLTWKAVAALVVVIILVILIYIEYRYLRRRREAVSKEGVVGDQAYNAIITVKAIAATLERGGVRSDEADNLIRMAEEARAKGEKRTAIQLTESAKGVLMAEKQRHRQMGDLAKLPAKAPESKGLLADEETTKARIEKELPKNYAQAKFMIASVEVAIDQARRDGRSVGEAVSLRTLAQKAFEEKDYDGALKHAVAARKAAEEIVIEIKPTDRVTAPPIVPVSRARVCKSCGAELRPEDVFCRKCGVKVEMLVCPSCGTIPREGDSFCRKCGVALA